MARRVPEHHQEGEGEGPDAQPTQDGILGGSAGIIPDAASKIVNPAEASSHAEIPKDSPIIETKRYRVANKAPAGKTGWPVVYDGCLLHMPEGKVVADNAYDIGKLLSQGVILEEV